MLSSAMGGASVISAAASSYSPGGGSSRYAPFNTDNADACGAPKRRQAWAAEDTQGADEPNGKRPETATAKTALDSVSDMHAKMGTATRQEATTAAAFVVLARASGELESEVMELRIELADSRNEIAKLRAVQQSRTRMVVARRLREAQEAAVFDVSNKSAWDSTILKDRKAKERGPSAACVRPSRGSARRRRPWGGGDVVTASPSKRHVLFRALVGPPSPRPTHKHHTHTHTQTPHAERMPARLERSAEVRRVQFTAV